MLKKRYHVGCIQACWGVPTPAGLSMHVHEVIQLSHPDHRAIQVKVAAQNAGRGVHLLGQPSQLECLATGLVHAMLHWGRSSRPGTSTAGGEVHASSPSCR